MIDNALMKSSCKLLKSAMSLGLLLPCLSVLAQPAALQQCRALVEAQARLHCYDAWIDAQSGVASTQSAAGSSAPVSAPIVQASTATAAATAATTASPGAASFGLEKQARKAELQEVESEISGLFEGWGPGQVIKLTNGQLWQINDGSSAVLYLKNPKVKVRRGVMGTYVLEFEASNHTAKVRRLER
jgi:hypothetical protein